MKQTQVSITSLLFVLITFCFLQSPFAGYAKPHLHADKASKTHTHALHIHLNKENISCKSADATGVDDLFDELNEDDDDEFEHKLQALKKQRPTSANYCYFIAVQQALNNSSLPSYFFNQYLIASYTQEKYIVFCVFRI